MAKKSTKKWTAAEITQLLRNRHDGQEWAFVTEVPNGTGLDMDRRCDGLAMCLWPSKGLHLHGYEIKVNRSDWLNEIQDVSKAAAFSRFCHYWWIAAPVGLVKLEELPATWGLMCPTSTGGLRAKKPATLTDPELPNHSLLAGMFRAACKASASEATIRAARREGYSDGYDSATKSKQHSDAHEHRDLERRLNTLQQSVDAFEATSGVRIRAYGGKQLGQLVQIVESLSPTRLQDWLNDFESKLAQVSARIKVTQEALQELEGRD